MNYDSAPIRSGLGLARPPTGSADLRPACPPAAYAPAGRRRVYRLASVLRSFARPLRFCLRKKNTPLPRNRSVSARHPAGVAAECSPCPRSWSFASLKIAPHPAPSLRAGTGKSPSHTPPNAPPTHHAKMRRPTLPTPAGPHSRCVLPCVAHSPLAGRRWTAAPTSGARLPTAWTSLRSVHSGKFRFLAGRVAKHPAYGERGRRPAGQRRGLRFASSTQANLFLRRFYHHDQ